jgi:hypothetical protein
MAYKKIIILFVVLILTNSRCGDPYNDINTAEEVLLNRAEAYAMQHNLTEISSNGTGYLAVQQLYGAVQHRGKIPVG